jgi:uncharacterized damage-inducible protein DinB
MKLNEFFLAQLEREMVGSRKALERVPLGKPDWKPHEKSMPMGYLATLVATMPSWIAHAVTMDELDLAPPGGSGFEPQTWETTAELLQMLDDAVAKARAALHGTDDGHLATTWKLLVGGNVVWQATREVVIADTFTHLAHHRGQLTVYLRLNDAPVPAIYGPSADERSF